MLIAIGLLMLRGRYNQANLLLLDGVLHADSAQLAAAEVRLAQLSEFEHGVHTTDWLAYLYFEQEQFEEAFAQFELAVQNGEHPIYNETTSEYWFLTAMRAEKQADWTMSLDAYRYGFSLHPQPWANEIYARYYQVLLNMLDAESQRVAEVILNGRFDSAEMTPHIPLALTECTDIIALQYDSAAVSAGPIVPIILHKADGTAENTFALNLVSNAGFGWTQRNDTIVGFEKTIYTQDDLTSTHQLVRSATPYAQDTAVGMLINTEQANWSSYQSHAIEIDSASLYFVGGWLSDQSVPRSSGIGFGWYARGLPDANPYRFLDQAQTTDWQFVADMLMMPTVADVDFVVTKQNAETAARTLIDDLFLLQFSPETCLPHGGIDLNLR